MVASDNRFYYQNDFRLIRFSRKNRSAISIVFKKNELFNLLDWQKHLFVN